MTTSRQRRFFHCIPVAIGLLLIQIPFLAFAAPGDLDNSFSNDGRVATGFEADDTYVNDIELQDNGKIVLAGGSGNKIGFARYRPNGRLDKTFSDDGRATVRIPGADNPYPAGIKVMKSGEILATGLGDFGGAADRNLILIRLKANGRLDRDFGNEGIVVTGFGGDDRGEAVLTHGGKIYVLGTSTGQGNYYDGIVARYHSNGKLDTKSDSDPNKHWSTDGKVYVDLNGTGEWFSALRFLRKGKVMAAGSSTDGVDTVFLLAKLNRSGKVENDFGTGGVKTAPFNNENSIIPDIEVAPDGFVAGSRVGTYPALDLLVRRYTKKGGVDESFDMDGMVQTDTGDTDYFGGLTVHENGKVLAVGTTENGESRILLVRYNKDGSPSANFGTAGIVKTEFPGALAGKPLGGEDVVLQESGRIVVAGYGEVTPTRAKFIVARYKN